VDVGFTTTAETLTLTWQKVGSGTVKGVNGKALPTREETSKCSD